MAERYSYSITKKTMGTKTSAPSGSLSGGSGISISAPSKSSTPTQSTPTPSTPAKTSTPRVVDGGRSAVTSDGVTVTKKDGGYVVNNGSSLSGTAYSGSDTKYNSGGGSLSSNTAVSTVQPVYISGGSGGSTYRVVNPDGTSYQFAVSGISLADASKYFAEKAASTSDPTKSAEYLRSAGDFAAAANYDAANNIRAKYGTGTGISYDATTALTLDSATMTTYLDPDKVEQYAAGNGLLGSSPSKVYYNAQTASRTLGGTLGDALGGGTIGDKTALEGAGTVGAGDPANVILGNQLKSTVNFDEVMSRGSELVNNFGNLPDILASNGTIAGAAGSFAATMLLPTDLVKVIKKISDGKAEEITGFDIGYAIADVLSFVPFLAPLKILKGVAKVPKIAGYASGALNLGTSGVDTLLNSGDGNPDNPAPKQDAETPEVPYPVKKPDEQTTTPPPAERNREYDMSGITDLLSSLFAGAGSNQAGESGGGSGGGDVTVVTNEAQPVDYSGAFRYIIPAIVIIGIIIVASKLLGNKKKGGSAA